MTFIDFGCVQRYSPEQRAHFQRFREGVLQNVRGKAFEVLMHKAFTVPEDLDPEVMGVLVEYLHLVFEPVTSPQPYLWTRAYSTDLLRHTMTLKQHMATRMLRGKKAYPIDMERADGGIAFLGRIVFGLGSILATLETEGDFHAMVSKMDARS